MFAQDLTKWHLDFVSPNVAKDVLDQSKLRIIGRHSSENTVCGENFKQNCQIYQQNLHRMKKFASEMHCIFYMMS